MADPRFSLQGGQRFFCYIWFCFFGYVLPAFVVLLLGFVCRLFGFGDELRTSTKKSVTFGCPVCLFIFKKQLYIQLLIIKGLYYTVLIFSGVRNK